MDAYTKGVLLTGILVPLVGLYIRRRSARIDLEARAEAKALDAPQAAIGLLTEQIVKRERELAELRVQDRAERDQYLKTLVAMERTMGEMAADLRALREEERAGRAKVHERLDKVDDHLGDVDKQLLVIKTRLETG